MTETHQHALVLVTVGSVEEGRGLARALVEERMAAGVQIMPIESVYVWEEKLMEDSEWLLIVKTRRDRFEEIEMAVRQRHSYDVPPVVMVGIEAANGDYLDWIDQLTLETR